MATVPTIDNFDASPTVVAPRTSSVASPGVFSAYSDEVGQVGKGVLAAGDELARIAIYQERQADVTRIDAAKNTLRGSLLHLKLDPQTGFVAQQGQDAMNKDDNGLALPDSYTAKAQKAADDIAGTLVTPYQKQRFAIESGNLIAGFKGEAQAHFLQQYHAYSVQTQKDGITTNADAADASWNDATPNGPRAQAITQAGLNAQRLAMLQPGWTPDSVKIAGDNTESAVHLSVLNQALKAGNVSYALQYFNDNKTGFKNPNDLLKAQTALQGQTEATAALGAVSTATQAHATDFMPQPLDRLVGAMGASKVQPGMSAADTATANAAAKADIVGYIKQYGDPTKAVAAATVGPVKIDEAIKKATDAKTPEAWMTFLGPKDQQAVSTTMNNYDNGVGAPQAPTKEQFVQTALNHLQPAEAANPKTVQLTRQQAEQQYTLTTASLNEHNEQLLSQGRAQILAAGGDYTKIDPVLLTEIKQSNPENVTKLTAFAKGLSNPNPATDWQRYYALEKIATTPGGAVIVNGQKVPFAQYDLSQEFPHLGDAQRQALIKLQNKDNNGLKDVATLQEQLSSAHAGFKWTQANNGPLMNEFDTKARNAIDSEQTARGKPLSYADRQKIIDDLMIKGTFKEPGDWFSTSGPKFKALGTPGASTFTPDK